MPIDPRRFGLSPEQRNADRLADLERLTAQQSRSSFNRVVAAVRATRSGIGSVPTGYSTASFTSADFDTNGMWNAAAPTRITAQVTGLYLLVAEAVFDGLNSVGVRGLEIVRGSEGWGVVRVGATPGGEQSALSSTVGLEMEAGDFVELLLLQTSGVSLPVGGRGPALSAFWVGAPPR